MSAPECDIKKKREIRRAKVAFLYYDAIKALENTMFSRVLLRLWTGVFPLQSFLRLFCCLNPLYEAVHAAGAFLPHFLGYMSVSVQRKCRCMVS